MAYTAMTSAEVAVGKPITSTLLTKAKDNFDWLYGRLNAVETGVGVVNGSFETDTDADGDPDNWTVSDYAGGSHSLSTAVATHGLQSLAFVHPGGAGNGGGTAVSDYIIVTTLYPVTLVWSYYSTNAATKVQINLRWYDVDQAYLSSTAVLSSTSNPTSWARRFGDAAWPVSTARYVKVELIGGYTDTNQAGTIYFDDVRLSQQYARSLCCGSVVNIAESTAYALLQGSKISVTEADVATEMPHGGVFQNLYVNCDISTTVTMRVSGQDSGLTTTNGGNDTSHTCNVTAGQTVDLKVVTTSATPANVLWGVELLTVIL